MDKKLQAEMHYTSELLDIIAHKDDFTQSDLQGVLMAMVMKIARDKDLLTFEERLQNKKDHDLQ